MQIYLGKILFSLLACIYTASKTYHFISYQLDRLGIIQWFQHQLIQFREFCFIFVLDKLNLLVNFLRPGGGEEEEEGVHGALS